MTRCRCVISELLCGLLLCSVRWMYVTSTTKLCCQLMGQLHTAERFQTIAVSRHSLYIAVLIGSTLKVCR